MRKAALFVSLVGVFLFAAGPACPALAAEKDVQKFERTFPFDEKDHKVGITVGDVTIESVQVKAWPNAEDYRKAEKDPNHTTTMWVVFTYTNNGTGDYKTKFTVTVLDPAEGAPFAVDDATRTHYKGKIGDTNRFGVKMKTRLYKVAKTFKVNFEIWKK